MLVNYYHDVIINSTNLFREYANKVTVFVVGYYFHFN